MTTPDHRRVLREMLEEREHRLRNVAASGRKVVGEPKWNAEVDALTAALAALEDRARLRERVGNLPRFIRPSCGDKPADVVVELDAVLALLSEGEPPKGET